MLTYPFANAFSLQLRLTYRTNFEDPRWRSYIVLPIFQYSLTQYVDLNAGITASAVAQNDTSNTFELRPMLGARFHLTPNRRALTRIYLRMEQRNFKDLETKNWTHSTRFRIRPELLFPLNRRSYFENNQLYLIADAEWFITVDKDVDERFANQFRARLGLGYRLDARWRFEGIYMQQQSKNKIGEEFYTSDNVVRLRVKFFFPRHKRESVPKTDR